MQTRLEGTAQTLIHIHGRLWPCEASSVEVTIKQEFSEHIISSQKGKAPESGAE